MLNELYQSLDPVAISAGPITIYWYGIAYIVGAIITGVVMYRTQRRWGLNLTIDDLVSVVVGVVFGGAAGTMPRHPSQLYEALLEGIVLFCVLQILSRRKPVLPQGTFMGVFVMGYGIVRFLIEFVRVPDAQLGYLLGGVITMGQLLSLPLVVAGAVLIVYAQRKARPQCDYLDK